MNKELLETIITSVEKENIVHLYDLCEAVVKECIRCCNDVDVIQKHYLKYGIDQELGANECIEVIRKHFEIT